MRNYDVLYNGKVLDMIKASSKDAAEIFARLRWDRAGRIISVVPHVHSTKPTWVIRVDVGGPSPADDRFVGNEALLVERKMAHKWHYKRDALIAADLLRQHGGSITVEPWSSTG